MAEQASEALKSALRDLDVDEDTFESLVEIVADTAQENPGKADDLAKPLEEALEPFLLALGAETTATTGIAMQVAVSLRGMSDAPSKTLVEKEEVKEDVKLEKLEKLEKNKIEKEEVKQAPKAKAKTKAEAKDSDKQGFTLASFCASAPGAAKKPKETSEKTGYPSTGPQTLGAMFSSKVDPDGLTTGWESGLQQGENADPDLLDDGIAQEDWQEALAEDKREGLQGASSKKKLGTKQARKAAAAANATTTKKDMENIASHGMAETQEALHVEGAGGRGLHVEGAGSRNIHMEGVNLSIIGSQGNRDLLKDANIHLSPGHVYGLLGKNGSGKTTLLRRFATKALPGMPRHLRFGYVAQEQSGGNGEETVLDSAINADEERRDLLKEKDDLEALLEGAESLTDPSAIAEAEKHSSRFAEVVKQLELIDADGAEDRAREVLTWMNFNESVMHQTVDSLSGGWRMRLALAKALCGRPDVLLLDEPTNHLDLNGVFWLQNHLLKEFGELAKKKERICVVVSHDRSFLDECASDILEIHNMKLRTFRGNYSNYVEQLAHEQACIQKGLEEQERQEKQAVKDLRAMKKKAREHHDDKLVRQLKSKEKKVERSRESQRAGEGFKLSSQREGGGDDLISKLRQDVNLRFRFPDTETIADDANLLELDSAKVKQGGKTILQNLILTLDPWSRVAIVGGNGAGKSTLMKALAGELKAEEGSRSRGRKHAAYTPGFVTQNHLEKMTDYLDLNCIEYLREHLPDQNTVRTAFLTKQSEDMLLRAHLGNFGMGDDALKKVGFLSGGQKARLSMAVATWYHPNVLLLDEPTNHLDVDSLDALTLGLQAFEGAVVVVSHNQGFLEALCDELWIVEKGGAKACPRGEEAFVGYFADYTKKVKASIR